MVYINIFVIDKYNSSTEHSKASYSIFYTNGTTDGDDNSRLKEQNETTKGEMEKLKEENSKLKSDIYNMNLERHMNSGMLSENRSLRGQVEQLIRDKEKLELDNLELSEKVSFLMEKLKEERGSPKVPVAEPELIIREDDQKLENLEKKLEAVTFELNSCNVKLKLLREENGKLHDELKSMGKLNEKSSCVCSILPT